MWTAGMVAVPDMFGVCGVDGGLVVFELVSVDGSAARDSSRLAGFPVTGLWAARRISCRRVQIGVGLSVRSRFAIKFPLVVGSSCSGYQSFGISKISYSSLHVTLPQPLFDHVFKLNIRLKFLNNHYIDCLENW
jgi:hypothetical protein